MNFIDRIKLLSADKKQLLAQQLGFWVSVEANDVLIIVEANDDTSENAFIGVGKKLKPLLSGFQGDVRIVMVDEVRFLGNGEIDRGQIDLSGAKTYNYDRSESKIPERKQSEIMPVPTAKSYPLSDAQKRMWVLSNFINGNQANNLPTQTNIRQHIDVSLFEKALHRTIERHESLRTTFTEDENGEIRQWIHEAEKSSFQLAYTDLTGQLNATEYIDKYIQNEFVTPFYLHEGPLFRAHLFKLKAEEFLLCYNMHHIISDGQSLDVLARDVMAFYAEELSGQKSNLLPLQVQYKDFAVWKHGELEEGKLEGSRKYWMDLLSGEIPVWVLGSAMLRPVFKTFNGESKSIFLDHADIQAHKAMSAAKGGTLFSSLVASLYVLLNKYSNQSELILGTPVSGREMAVLEDQIGLYVNTLLIKEKLEPKDTYLVFYERIKKSLMNSFDHRSYPFDLLVEELDLKRDVSRGALFDIMVSLQENNNIQVSDAEKTSASLGEIIHHGKALSKFDLNFSFKSVNENLVLNLVYNADIYPGWLMDQLLHDYRSLFGELVQNSSQTLSTIQLKSASFFLPESQSHYKEARETIPGKFRNIVRQFPDNIAVISGEKQLTYKDLDELSDTFAHYLIHQFGNTREQLVGIRLPRNEWWLIAILGVLKSGKAYIPIDENTPENKTTYILKDSNSAGCIDEQFIQTFSAADAQQLSPTEVDISPADLAYVIYTSGTTGDPKGVMVEHQALINYQDWFNDCFEITAKDSSIITSSFSFDGILTCLYGTLFSGGTLHILDEALIKDARFTTNYIKEQKVSFLKGTPTYLHYLLSEGNSKALLDNPHLKLIITGGERANIQDVKQIVHEGSCRLINHYGPTECTVGVAFHEITRENLHTFEKFPVIGKAIDPAEIILLDGNGNPVPKGVVGELVVTGSTLARGYLGERKGGFTTNALFDGKRCYRTGDYGYRTETGEINFTGRIDDQVKIRGNRVALGEINEVLLSIENIQSAYVDARKEEDGYTLIAYYQASREVEANELRQSMRLKLPDFMIPSYFVQLEKMPLSTTGKIDKKQLPEPERKGSQAKKAPTTESEVKAVAIWKEILNKEEIWVNDDFFDVGGHSLKAMKLINAYHHAFGKKLSLSDIFSNATLESHIALLEISTNVGLPSIPLLGQSEDYETTATQKRLWALCQDEKANIAHNIPRVYNLNGNLNPDIIQQIFVKILNRHEALRTCFALNGQGELRQKVQNMAELGFQTDFVDFTDKNYALEQILIQEIRMPFDLAKAPLIRVKLFKTGQEQFILCYTLHHLIADGWSMELILNELLEEYTSISENGPSVLSELPLQFKDFAAWQNNLIANGMLQKEIDFWKESLNGKLARVNIPADFQSSGNKSFNGGLVSRLLSGENVKAIRSLVNSNDATLFMGLLGVLNTLLHKYSGADNILVGTPTAGRVLKELESQVGFYVNTLALSNDVSANDDFRAHLNNVRQNTLDAFAHQAMPFDELIEQIKEDESINAGIINVMIVLHNLQLNPRKTTKGLNIHQNEDVKHTISKLDLIFNFMEEGDNILLNLEYNSDIFAHATISAMAAQFDHFLGLLASNSGTPMQDLEYISEEEKQLIDTQFNATSSPFSEDKNIIDLVNRMSEAHPGSVAVISGEVQLTYKELISRSEAYAHCLRTEYNIEKGDVVALKSKRNETWVISILAIMKAGAVYLPIDVNIPEKRAAYMMETANCKFCITEEVIERLKTYESSGRETAVTILPEDPAYIIYTSGSTGKSKGVIGTHTGLVNRIEWVQSAYPMEKSEVCCAKTTPAFVDHITELFTPLASGVPLVIAGDDTIVEIDRFIDFLYVNKVSRLVVVPSLLKAVLKYDQLKTDKLASLKIVFSSGEKLENKVIDDFYHTFPDKKLVNLYGSSEVTGDVTCIETEPGMAHSLIGKPISNTEIQILDSFNKACPIGIIGEINVAGTGIAKGYTQEQETLRAFVSGRNGELTYKTGDFGRWRADGTIQYFGRKDALVKVRGMQLSLEEVKKELAALPGITSAEVIFDQESENLIGLYVSDKEIPEETIARDLFLVLPAYMIPVRIVHMEAFPLLVNGKVDRQELRKILDTSQEKNYVAPANDIERTLVSLWEETLNRTGLGVEDDFFKVGGHSLKATQMISRINKEFEVKLAVGIMFKGATIRSLAEKIDFIKNQESQKQEKTTEFKEIKI